MKPTSKQTRYPSSSNQPTIATGNSFWAAQTLANVSYVSLSTTNGTFALKVAIHNSLNDVNAVKLWQIYIVNITARQDGKKGLNLFTEYFLTQLLLWQLIISCQHHYRIQLPLEIL